jgi:hypothetical protein
MSIGKSPERSPEEVPFNLEKELDYLSNLESVAGLVGYLGKFNADQLESIVEGLQDAQPEVLEALGKAQNRQELENRKLGEVFGTLEFFELAKDVRAEADTDFAKDVVEMINSLMDANGELFVEYVDANGVAVEEDEGNKDKVVGIRFVDQAGEEYTLKLNGKDRDYDDKLMRVDKGKKASSAPPILAKDEEFNLEEEVDEDAALNLHVIHRYGLDGEAFNQKLEELGGDVDATVREMLMDDAVAEAREDGQDIEDGLRTILPILAKVAKVNKGGKGDMKGLGAIAGEIGGAVGDNPDKMDSVMNAMEYMNDAEIDTRTMMLAEYISDLGKE